MVKPEEQAVVAALDLPLDTVVGHVLDLHRRGLTMMLTLDPARGHRRHPDRVIPDRATSAGGWSAVSGLVPGVEQPCEGCSKVTIQG
jgi:hypothetical protein